MVELLEKRLGAVVDELKEQREQLRRELAKVEHQLELLKNLLRGSRTTAKITTSKKPAPAKTAKAAASKKTVKTKAAEQPKAPDKTLKGKPGRRPNSAGGKTLKEELFAIAKANGGKFTIKEASLALVKAGRYYTPERAAANIHSAIANAHGAIVRDTKQRGLYRIKG